MAYLDIQSKTISRSPKKRLMKPVEVEITTSPHGTTPVGVEVNVVSIKGFRFSYKLYTSPSFRGDPVFFVSGAFQSMKSWRSVAGYFTSRGMPVILADLPGTGESDLLPVHYGLNLYADSIKLVIDTIGIDKVSIVAASYGTPIAYAFAAQNPSRVNKLILAGTMKEIPCHMRAVVQHTVATLREGRMDEFAKEVADSLVVTDLAIPISRRDLAHRLLCTQLMRMKDAEKEKYITNSLRLLSHDPLDLSSPPTCPTLVYTGEHDSFTTPEFCLEIANSIPCSYFTTIKKADHMFHLEQPDVVNKISFEFLQYGGIISSDGIGPVEKTGSANFSLLDGQCVAA